ncbi:MAG: GNAT family N-acetyltransferase [Maricaulis sp.]|nr:GNAT family N-acetyltransferase [Maricaulis sp.]MDG2044298.1 GNAT family N-acetyltransferase [Maricaulis sp.]
MPILLFEKDRYLITDNPEAFDVRAAHKLLSGSYWSPGIPLETVRQAAANSWTFCLLSPGGDFAGMARFITDYASFAYLADVIISPEHRGKGLGVWMMQVMHDLPQIKACRRLMLMTGDAHDLYARLGYQAMAHPELAMEIHRPNLYTRDILE